ncbi:MAG: autotransporter domain-containing protein [Pseudomonadota bacterium]
MAIGRRLKRGSILSGFILQGRRLALGFALFAQAALLFAVRPMAESLAEACDHRAPCIATGEILSPFLSLPDSPEGQDTLDANLQRVEEIYLNSSAADKALAATNSQLQNPVIPVRNVWALAVPELSDRFSAGALPDPGPNAPPVSVISLVEATFQNIEISIDPLKSYFALSNIYGEAYGALPGVTNEDPRPYQVSETIAGAPWTTAETTAVAVAIQQTEDPPPPYANQSWMALDSSPAFPSGHSTGGNTIAIFSAVMAPEYHKELVAAGVEFAFSRNVFGVHYPLDVIGGRIIATVNAAAMLNGTYDYPASVTLDDVLAAGQDLQAYLGSGGQSAFAKACSPSVATCIREGAIPSAEAFAEARADYRWFMTYDLPPVGPTDLDPVVPEGAEVLLLTRFPYLSAEQRRDVLATTQAPSGSALGDGSGWARIDLFAAGDGYGAFHDDVTVTLDSDKGGFHAFDVWANPISGAGGLTKAGDGTLVLAGMNSYSGGTVVEEGTLAISGAIQGPLRVAAAGKLYNGGQVTIAAGGQVTSAGDLVNDGQITGDVDNSGLLENNGEIRGDLTNSGLLTGNGSLTGSLTSSGRVSPGQSIGQITVAGPVTLSPTSTFAVELASDGTADRLAATGPVTLQGGTLEVTLLSPETVGLQSFTIVTSETAVDGRFAEPDDPLGSALPFLALEVLYGAESVVVETKRSDQAFDSLANTANQAASAQALDSLAVEGPLLEALVSTNADTAPQAFDALSGEVYASAQTLLLAQAALLRDSITGRLRQATTAGERGQGSGPDTASLVPGFKPTLWVEGYGNWGSNDVSANTARLSYSNSGLVVGLDTPLGDNLRLGLAAGFSQSSFDVTGRRSSGDTESIDLAVYGTGQWHAVTLRGAFTYGWQGVSVDRTAAFAGFSDALSSDYDARSLQIFGEVGYGMAFDSLSVEPFAGLTYVNLETDSFTESGGAAALQGEAESRSLGFSSLGLRVGSAWPLWQGQLLADASLAWQRTIGDRVPTSSLAFTAGGNPFSVQGAALARDSALVGFDLGYRAGEQVTLGIAYAGNLAGSARSNAVTGQLTVQF